jgi:integrase
LIQKVDESVDGGFPFARWKETKMARERKGTITKRDGKLYARVQFKDEMGKRRDLWRRAESRTHARQLIRELLKEIENSTAVALDAANMTFEELAAYFERHYLQPAQYVDGRKVSGVRSLIPALAAINALRAHFGARRLRSITHSDLDAYRVTRLKTPTQHGKQRAIASVNRELSKARRMFNVAIQRGWLAESPFKRGGTLISNADEVHRERVLSREEESRLLAAIEAEPKRGHLKGIVLIALDCGLRRGEILTLTWGDVDLSRRTIMVRAFNAKTARSRTVGMTIRVHETLTALFYSAPRAQHERVFDIASVKRSFTSACRVAGIDDFRLHDARHTFITRAIRAGLPPVEVIRLSGHANLSGAFYRYCNLDSDAVFRAAAALDAYHAQAPEAQTINAPEQVN